jgi:hypothetical protein
LKKDLEDRRHRQSKLIEAIETNGDITSLTARLREVDLEMKRIQEAIDAYRPLKLDVSVREVRDYVTQSLRRFQELLTDRADCDLARAKKALIKHLGKLVLTPTNARRSSRVSGNG